jgi:uncharacterized membrane protein YeaQ/YmgE (transglycosylase-associated protein family)
MEGVSLIGFLVVGLIAGWLGGKIIRGGGSGSSVTLLWGWSARFWEVCFSTRQAVCHRLNKRGFDMF